MAASSRENGGCHFLTRFETVRQTRLLVLAVCISLLSTACGAAVTPENAQSLKKLSLEQLGKVQVSTYSKTPSELWNTPAAVYVITNEEILRSGATTIADALELAPGVEVGRVSSTTWAVGIRGLQSNFSKSVLVLIDGRNVYTPLFAGVYWDVQDMPLDDVDHIEVIRGPGATVWGPNAANGVINIITKHAADTRGVFADALVGTQDRTIDDLQFGSAGAGFDYRVFGRGFARNHEYHPDGQNVDSWHQARFGFRGDRTEGPNLYFIEGDLYKGTSPHIVGTSSVSNDETSGGDINFRWSHGLTLEKGFYLQAYFDRTLRTHAYVGETRNTINVDFTHHFRAGEKNLVSYGGTLRWSPWNTVPTGALTLGSGKDHEHVGFLQDEIRLANNVRLTLGAKIENNNYSGWDFTPSGRVVWSGERQSLWGAVTRAVTTPSDIEENLFIEQTTGTTVLQLLGSKTFQSEGVVGYEAGYRLKLGKQIVAGLTGFWNEYSRLQSFAAPTISTSGGITYITARYSNQISGAVSGAELGLQAQIAPWWRVIPTYSYQNSDFAAHGATVDVSSTGSVRTYEGSSPKHMVKVISRIDLPGRVQFDQWYRYISALPAQSVPAYETMDLHFEKALGSHLSLAVVGQNLFQPRHAEWGTGDPARLPLEVNRAAYVRLVFRAVD